jgi:hypothetical protein
MSVLLKMTRVDSGPERDPVPSTAAVDCSGSGLGRVHEAMSLNPWECITGDIDFWQARVIRNGATRDLQARVFAALVTYFMLADNWLAIFPGSVAICLVPARSFG